jgi:hypothetical protein
MKRGDDDIRLFCFLSKPGSDAPGLPPLDPRQAAFRREVEDSGVSAAYFGSPDELKDAVSSTLKEGLLLATSPGSDAPRRDEAMRESAPSDGVGGWVLRKLVEAQDARIASGDLVLPRDLDLRADVARAVTDPAFGAAVVDGPSGERILAVPVRVASFAVYARLNRASQVLNYVRAYPTIAARLLGLSHDDVSEKTKELKSLLAGHVGDELLAEPERRPVAYGAWPATRPVKPTS